jgi:pentatricopeptide repeat protein
MFLLGNRSSVSRNQESDEQQFVPTTIKKGEEEDTHQVNTMPDFKTYSMFISFLCKEGRSEEGMQLLSEMLRVGFAPSTVNFRDVFYGLNRERKQNLAQTVLRRKWDFASRRKLLN